MSLAYSDPATQSAPEFLKLWTKAADSVVSERVRARSERHSVSRYRHLLGLRFILINLAAFSLLFAAATQGWVSTVLQGDETMLTTAIMGVFVVGLVVAGWRIWELTIALNAAEAPHQTKVGWIRDYVARAGVKDAGARAIAGSSLRMQLASRIAFVKYIANSLVLLGLIGTVIGFIIALSGVSAESAADPSAIAPMVGDLIRGMSVALYTTLAGAVFNLWLMANYNMLVGGAARLAGRMIEAAEDAALLESHHEQP